MSIIRRENMDINMNTYSITLKKIRSSVGLELSINKKKLDYFLDNPMDGILVRKFEDKQVVEICADIINKAEVHIFTTELNETMDRAGDSVIEVRVGDMLIDRHIVAKLGPGYGYRVFELNNYEYNLNHEKFR